MGWSRHETKPVQSEELTTRSDNFLMRSLVLYHCLKRSTRYITRLLNVVSREENRNSTNAWLVSCAVRADVDRLSDSAWLLSHKPQATSYKRHHRRMHDCGFSCGPLKYLRTVCTSTCHVHVHVVLPFHGLVRLSNEVFSRYVWGIASHAMLQSLATLYPKAIRVQWCGEVSED